MNRFRTLFWRFYLPVCLPLLTIFIFFTLYLGDFCRRIHADETNDELKRLAQLIAEGLLDDLAETADSPQPEAITARIAALSGDNAENDLYITLFLPDAGPFGDRLDDDASRRSPMIESAFRGITYTVEEYHHELKSRIVSLAVPLKRNEAVVGVLRVARPMKRTEAVVRGLRIRIAFIGVVSLLATAAGILHVSRKVADDLDAIRYGAEQFETGNMAYRLVSPPIFELARLARSMNRMVGRIDRNVRRVAAERDKLEIVLQSMMEGVIAIDADERITSINRAAARMFYRAPNQVRGRTIQEVVRNSELNRFVRRTLALKQPAESEITLYYERESIMKVQSSPLKCAEGEHSGILLVFHDITHIRSLENMRRDFAANVSHEIRTPLTAIKGFVETLRNGAIEKPEEAERFLGIIERHANRLSNIIDDLMKLSEIEIKEHRGLMLQKTPVRSILKNAMDLCRISADSKSITMKLTCAPELIAELDGPLLEQAVVNLIDNAVKYSQKGNTVWISAHENGADAVIQIEDEGMGIPNEHLKRLWERFYRVDRSRSRKQGGTGLGLAIVKHIVKAHGGGVDVKSEVRKGSVFEIRLPKSAPDLSRPQRRIKIL